MFPVSSSEEGLTNGPRQGGDTDIKHEKLFYSVIFCDDVLFGTTFLL